MEASHLPGAAGIRTILHPTDFSEGSDNAFAHALRLAVAASAQLELLHAEPDNDVAGYQHYPKVCDTLVRWEVLPPGAGEADLERLGLRIDRVLRVGDPPLRSILEELDAHHADLMVLATHGREGLDRMYSGGVAEPASRHGGVRTLFLPPGVRGFVPFDDGVVTLRRILIPIDHLPDPELAVAAAVMMARTLGVENLQISTLYAGSAANMPKVGLPTQPGWVARRWQEEGAPVEAILDTARAWQADLIVMSSRGHDSVLDTLRGSTVERVLRHAPCPVLVVPDPKRPS